MRRVTTPPSRAARLTPTLLSLVAALTALAAGCDDETSRSERAADVALDDAAAPDRGPAPVDTGPSPDGSPGDLDGSPDDMAASDADAIVDAGLDGPDGMTDAMADTIAPDAGPRPSYDPHCDDLVDGHCMLPWPSDRWLMPADDTVTGYRLTYDIDGTPTNRLGRPIDPTPYLRFDGFSPSSQLLTVFPRPADLTGYDGPDDIERSLADDFPTVVLDLETGERVPHWIENDARADEPSETVLYIRPATRLRPDRAYGVAIRGLRDADGALLPSPPGFAALRDRMPSPSPELEVRRGGMEALFAALGRVGVARETVQQAWRFHTESFASGHDTLLAMRADAIARLGDRGLGCTVTEVEEGFDDGRTFRIVRGTITTPWYLDAPTQPAQIVMVDGVPQHVEDREVPFTALVPESALDEQARLVYFGHGLFGEADGTLQNGRLRGAAHTLNAVFFATDWAGMSTSDVAFLGTALIDVSRFWHLGEMLQQGIINHIAMARTARGLCANDVAFRVAGQRLYDPTRRMFVGVSQGSILGGTLLALHPDVDRGALLVGGTGFSFMIERSIHYNQFQLLLDPNYPQRIDRALLMAMSQHTWDRAESASWLEHLEDGLPDIGPKRALYFVAENDAQVPNLSSHRAARLAGLPVIDGSTHVPWGTEVVAPPYDGSAYLAFDLGDRPPVGGNVAPEQDDGGHAGLPVHPAALDVMDRFFDEGIVDVQCDGICRFD